MKHIKTLRFQRFLRLTVVWQPNMIFSAHNQDNCLATYRHTHPILFCDKYIEYIFKKSFVNEILKGGVGRGLAC